VDKLGLALSLVFCMAACGGSLLDFLGNGSGCICWS
jgi:hypothetical protein